jgi:DNA (cytosine-5)-methyltransferase 1
MIGASLFSSAGIAETFLGDIDINIVVANELLEERANLYRSLYKDSHMITGDIQKDSIFKEIIKRTPDNLDFLIASPPCQGMSVAGKNRNVEQMLMDERNYLVFKVIEFIQLKNPKYILIENVPTFFKLLLSFQKQLLNVVDILNILFKDEYTIEAQEYDSSLFGVPQKRIRAIVKIYKKGTKWNNPKSEGVVTVEDAISHLPSLEASGKSSIKWHFARKHSERHILWMKYTPTGKTAFENNVYYPVKENGDKIKSYMTTYRRIKWDEPAPTITMRNDAISSQLNVHPGRKLPNGLYSDARVLTPLELMILSSLPANWNIPDNTNELLIRKSIGECIPPLLIKKIVEQIHIS